MRRKYSEKNMFSDKATLILRKMLSQPEKEWVTRDFTMKNEVSLGLAQGVLESMSERGYIERVKQGPRSHSHLTRTDQLIHDWLDEYRFEINRVETYYSPDKNILPKIKACLNTKSYALTLHTGANLFTSYVLTDHAYFYFSPEDWSKEILELRQYLDLKQLVSGGNIHIIQPYYKNSVYYKAQTITGYRIVSNLQLFLDLYHFQPRGREQAEYLKRVLEEKGKSLYES